MRYVLLCREETPDPDDLRTIASAAGLKVLDHSVPRALLVEASEGTVDKLRSELKQWTIAEEVVYSLPSHLIREIRPQKGRKKGPA